MMTMALSLVREGLSLLRYYCGLVVWMFVVATLYALAIPLLAIYALLLIVFGFDAVDKGPNLALYPNLKRCYRWAFKR